MSKTRTLMRAVWALIAVLALPTAARAQQAPNLALDAAASASSEYSQGGFEAARANDGRMTTRWNDDCAEATPSLTLTWSEPVTVNLVVVRAAFDRISRYRIQSLDAGTGAYVDVHSGTAPGTGRTDVDQTLRSVLTAPVTTTSLRFVADQKTGCVSVWEIEAYNTRFGTLAGKVTDFQGAPVSGATVSVDGATAVTGEDGAYSVLLDPGTHDVLTTADPDFMPRWTRQVTVEADQTTTRDIRLARWPENLALNAPTEVSSTDPTFDDEGNDLFRSEHLVDDDLETAWLATEARGAWFGVDFGEPVTFNRIRIFEWGVSISELSVQVQGEEGGGFVEVDRRAYDAPRSSPVIQITLPTPATARRVRLEVTGFRPQEEGEKVGIIEMQVLNTPLGIVTGRVVDAATQTGLTESVVVVEPGSFIFAFPDATGTFTTPVDPDDYLLWADAPGYFRSEQQVARADPDSEAELTFRLAPKGANLALNASATASSQADTAASSANDDDLNTYWEAQSAPASLTLTWPAPVTFNRILVQEFGDRSREMIFEVWDASAGAFVEVAADVSAGSGQDFDVEHFLDLPGRVTTDRLRIRVPSAESSPRFREVEVYDFTPPDAGPDRPKGDADGSGAADIRDVVHILRIVAGLTTPSPEDRAAADVDRDGSPTVRDVLLLLRFLAGLVPSLP